MLRRQFSKVIFASIFIFAPRAFAQGDHFTFHGTLFYDSHDNVSENEKSTNTDLTTVFGAGYVWGSGLYIGGKYYRDKLEGQSSVVSGTDTVSSLGLSLGFMRKGVVSLIASYLFDPERTVEATTGTIQKTTLKGGTGTLFEIGYPAVVNSSFCLGPVASQAKVTYKKSEQTSSGLSTSESLNGEWNDTWTRIGIGFWINL